MSPGLLADQTEESVAPGGVLHNCSQSSLQTGTFDGSRWAAGAGEQPWHLPGEADVLGARRMGQAA